MLPGFYSRRKSRNTSRPLVAQKVRKRSIQISWSLIFNNIQRSALWQAIEKQLDLPAALVERGNGQRRQEHVVGEEHQSLAGVGIFEADAPQLLGIVLGH